MWGLFNVAIVQEVLVICRPGYVPAGKAGKALHVSLTLEEMLPNIVFFDVEVVQWYRLAMTLFIQITLSYCNYTDSILQCESICSSLFLIEFI